MFHHLISLLHNDTYNWYWFGALVLTLVTAPVSVVLSHIQQYRQHPGWRLVSDSLVRAQLAFFSYGAALFISAYFQADQKVLGPWFGILEGLGVLFCLVGVWLTSPKHLSNLHAGNEECEADSNKPCLKSLTLGAKIQMVAMPLLLFGIAFALAVILTFAVTDGKAATGSQSGSTIVPTELAIGVVRVGGDAYRDAHAFMRDNLDRLDQERKTATNPDYVVAVIESTPTLSAYGHYCWTLSLAQDYQADFALSARAAYLVHAGVPRTFTELDFRGQGQPYISIVAEVPNSSSGDKVVVVMSIYAKNPGSKVLHEVRRMLEAEVNCR